MCDAVNSGLADVSDWVLLLYFIVHCPARRSLSSSPSTPTTQPSPNTTTSSTSRVTTADATSGLPADSHIASGGSRR